MKKRTASFLLTLVLALSIFAPALAADEFQAEEPIVPVEEAPLAPDAPEAPAEPEALPAEEPAVDEPLPAEVQPAAWGNEVAIHYVDNGLDAFPGDNPQTAMRGGIETIAVKRGYTLRLSEGAAVETMWTGKAASGKLYSPEYGVLNEFYILADWTRQISP